MPLYLAGAQVLEVFPVLPLIANEPLGVGALSYAGAFSIGVVADQDAFPDLDVFTAGVRQALRALGVSTIRRQSILGRRLRRLSNPRRATAAGAGDDRALVAQAARPEGDGDP